MVNDLSNIETPAFVVNEKIAKRNIQNFQDHCNAAGLALRPHIKTHKSVFFAKMQIEAGAVGITCQKISEAEVMKDGGLDDILITYNILGETKLKRLRRLWEHLKALAVTADNKTVIEGLSATFGDANRPLTVLVECDTGAGRCGVQSPNEAADIGGKIAGMPGLKFGGLMTYPAVGGQQDVAKFMRATVKLLKERGLTCPVISSGGSPDMWAAKTDNIITEYRIGTYIYNDRSLVARGSCQWSDCAGQVITTVVSTPKAGRAIIDAGSKVLTSDLLGFADFGSVVDLPDASIVSLSEEHGILNFNPDTPLKIGQRLKIVPNHVCVVSNMFDQIWIDRDVGNLAPLAIDARGKVW